MKTLEEKCSELCKNKHGDILRFTQDRDLPEIANKLAKLLLDANAVNTKWSVEPYAPGGDTTEEGIVNFLQYMNNDLIGQLLAKGLDLNQDLSFGGAVPFTWFIGNAQNELVDQLLTSAEHNQTLEQRLVWINKPDSMKRPMKNNSGDQARVGQTPLQLVIAKGYTNKSGSGDNLNVSNLQIAKKLLRLGADQQINYQEPTKGNTALHIAYARRDYKAIKLLEHYRASQSIRNIDEDKPADMLSLSFSEVEKLMEFHTSPEGHPDTFRLEQREFDNAQNLQKIYDGVKTVRPVLEVIGNGLKLPSDTFSFNPLQSAAIMGEDKIVSSLVSNGANPQRARESIQHRIDLLKFMQEDNLLHLQNLPWQEYVNKRQAIDDKYNGISNPYMYDINETGYTSLQNYVNNNKDEFLASVEKSAHQISMTISQLEGGIPMLKDTIFTIILKEYAKTADTNHLEKLITSGKDMQIITTSLQEVLDHLHFSLHFNKTIVSLMHQLTTNNISSDDCCTKLNQAYEKAGGQLNPYLPKEVEYPIAKDRVEETKVEFLSKPDELNQWLDFQKKEIAKIESEILTCERAINLFETTASSIVSSSPSEPTASASASSASTLPDGRRSDESEAETAVQFGKNRQRVIPTAQQKELRKEVAQIRSGGEDMAPVDFTQQKDIFMACILSEDKSLYKSAGEQLLDALLRVAPIKNDVREETLNYLDELISQANGRAKRYAMTLRETITGLDLGPSSQNRGLK